MLLVKGPTGVVNFEDTTLSCISRVFIPKVSPCDYSPHTTMGLGKPTTYRYLRQVVSHWRPSASYLNLFLSAELAPDFFRGSSWPAVLYSPLPSLPPTTSAGVVNRNFIHQRPLYLFSKLMNYRESQPTGLQATSDQCHQPYRS